MSRCAHAPSTSHRLTLQSFPAGAVREQKTRPAPPKVIPPPIRTLVGLAPSPLPDSSF